MLVVLHLHYLNVAHIVLLSYPHITSFGSKNAFFHDFNSSVTYGPTDGPTDGRTDGRMDGGMDRQTHPLIEMRERI